MPRNIVAKGVFTTLQKTPSRPKAAQKPGSKPKKGPTTAPKVEPTKKAGIISPP